MPKGNPRDTPSGRLSPRKRVLAKFPAARVESHFDGKLFKCVVNANGQYLGHSYYPGGAWADAAKRMPK